MLVNEKYSFKDFTGQDLSDLPASEFNNTIVKGSCFAQENGWTDVFPPDMDNVEFVDCNLSNVNIPGASSMTGCACFEHHVQNDLEDWRGPKTDPQEPVGKKGFVKLQERLTAAGSSYSISHDPADLSAEVQDAPVTHTARKVLQEVEN